jgi:hypothetical protein
MENRGTVVLGVVLGVVALGVFPACRGKKGVAGPDTTLGTGDGGELRVPRVDPSLCDTKGKKVETFDLNRDNKPNVWKLYASVEEGGTVTDILTCKQVDYDSDGRMDYVAIYDRTGQLVAEEIDRDFDGKVMIRAHYDPKTGHKVLVERVSTFGGQPDIWEKYDDGGKLELVLHDRNGDGKPDVWEQYVDGELVAILYDDTFDNRVDRREERRVQRTAAPTPPPTDAPEEAEFVEDERQP